MTSISAPTSLAHFSTPQASSSKLPPVQLNAVNGSNGRLAVAAVQGDGIWTYDLNNLRPTTSFTVPPSTIFSTRPISFYPPARFGERNKEKQKAVEKASMDVDQPEEEASNEGPHRVTLVGIQSGEKIRKEEEGRCIWVWRGEEGAKKTIVILPHKVQSIHYIDHHRAPILVVHQNGTMSALDMYNNVRPITLSSSSNAPGAILAINTISLQGPVVRLAAIYRDGQVQTIELNLSGPDAISGQIVKTVKLLEKGKETELKFADVSENGVVTATSASGRIFSQQVGEIPTVARPPVLAHSAALAPMSLPVPGKPISLIAVSDPTPTLLLLSSSSNVPAVLAATPLTTVIAPTTATITDLSILAQPTPGTFVCGAGVVYAGEAGGRSVIYTFEVTVPERGIGLKHLLGTHAKTAEYLRVGGAASSSESSVQSIVVAIKANDSAATSKVTDWVKEYGKSNNQASESSDRTSLNKGVQSIVQAVIDTALIDGPEGEGKLASGKYASGVIKTLLARKLVNEAMIDGGVTSALIKLEDIDNGSLAIQNIATVPSSSLIAAIHLAITSPTSTIDIKSVLRDILNLPTPPPDYRAALRAHLSVDDAARVLEVYSEWLEHYAEKRGQGLGQWDDDNYTPMLKSPVPELEAITTHTSLLLDSHLPLLMSYPSSHALLESLQESLVPLLQLQESYRKLRAPVEAVLVLSRREAKKQEERKKTRVWTKSQGMVDAASLKKGGPKKGKAALPEEMVGKWRVEEFVF